jgi:hypothetical protein
LATSGRRRYVQQGLGDAWQAARTALSEETEGIHRRKDSQRKSRRWIGLSLAERAVSQTHKAIPISPPWAVSFNRFYPTCPVQSLHADQPLQGTSDRILSILFNYLKGLTGLFEVSLLKDLLSIHSNHQSCFFPLAAVVVYVPPPDQFPHFVNACSAALTRLA